MSNHVINPSIKLQLSATRYNAKYLQTEHLSHKCKGSQ